jgi:hypothetical protein
VIHCYAGATVEINNYLNYFVIKNKELMEIFTHKNEVI